MQYSVLYIQLPPDFPINKISPGNIKNISVYVEHLNVTVDKYLAPNSCEINVGNGNPSKDYKYICTFTDYNGNEYTKTLEVDNDVNALQPKDFVLTITETENNTYTVECSYDTNKCEVLYLYLYHKDTKYTFDANNKLTFESETPVTEDEIRINAFTSLYGYTSMNDVTDKIINLTIENLDDNATGNKDDNSTTGNGMSSCNFGFVYISSFILLSSLSILLIKRK